MNLRAWGPALLLMMLFVGVLMLPAKTNTPYKFLDDRAMTDNDQQRVLNTIVQHYGVTRERLEPIVKGLGKMETELPVLLYVADKSGKPLETILELRRGKRLDWIEVMRKTDVKLSVLFEGVAGSFPEPYKSSWTEWRMKYRPELTDEQVRELVMLQIAHAVSGRPMKELVKTQTLPLEVLAMGKPVPKESPAKAAAEERDVETPKKPAKKAAAGKPRAR
jgi:hypothetical protein